MDKSKNLIWIDLEMTGLCTRSDSIIEIATIVTDQNLDELAEGPALAIRRSQQTMDAMDDWNTRLHIYLPLSLRNSAERLCVFIIIQ